jgi:hypothetical protein
MNKERRELLFGTSAYAVAFRKGAKKYMLIPAYIGLVSGAVMIGYVFVLNRVMTGTWKGQHVMGWKYAAYGCGGMALIFIVTGALLLRAARSE